jgi:hypothetical protein
MLESLHGLFRDSLDVLVHSLREFRYKVAHQERDVLAPLA